jgi:organic hydroperoxide reductase OsmC/OhrA
MSSYSAFIEWRLGEDDFLSGNYSRGHSWRFDGGVSVPASASPHVVPAPHSVAEAVDPEEAFVAALASCHMLFFLSIASGRGVLVRSYRDHATAHMEKDERGRTGITRVLLRPEATYAGDIPPARGELERMHEQAHSLCFIANSVRSEVVTEIIS